MTWQGHHPASFSISPSFFTFLPSFLSPILSYLLATLPPFLPCLTSFFPIFLFLAPKSLMWNYLVITTNLRPTIIRSKLDFFLMLVLERRVNARVNQMWSDFLDEWDGYSPSILTSWFLVHFLLPILPTSFSASLRSQTPISNWLLNDISGTCYL